MKYFLFIPIFLLVALIVISAYLSHPSFQGHENEQLYKISIASISQGITLARDIEGNVFLLTHADNIKVEGINLTLTYQQKYADAVEAYQLIGKEALVNLYSSEQSQTLEWSNISTPVLGHKQHIAVGTNYSAHADEVGLERSPFLFPKLSKPTPWNAEVKASTRLDHEIELCAVTLSNYKKGDTAEAAIMLCGDFTDRWQLLMDIDLSGAMGKTGFVDAKGNRTHLPLGPFLLFPHNKQLMSEIQLNLYVNKQKRQQGHTKQMLWSLSDILDRTLDDCQSVYQGLNATYSINNNCNFIPTGTIVLTGTPEGVMFNPITMWNPYYYLQPGDHISSFGTYLGKIINHVK
jgi:2-keto-4-pentenoate hydratase/2-oxohepta-3-ene-1,7-dioic acid hydratase in catechol pathway